MLKLQPSYVDFNQTKNEKQAKIDIPILKNSEKIMRMLAKINHKQYGEWCMLVKLCIHSNGSVNPNEL